MVLTVLFPALGWLIAVACLAFAAAAFVRAVQLPKGRRLRPGLKGVKPGLVAVFWACLAAACLTGLGAIGLLQGIVASVVLFVIAVIGLRRSGAVGAHLKAGVAWARHDAAALRERVPRPPAAPDDAPAAASGPAAATAGGGPARTPPPLLREDTALGPVPAPEEVITGVVVPAPWAELAGVIAGYVPPTDIEQSRFLAGGAAGLVAVAQAYATHADSLVSEVGVDPAYAAAIVEFGERIAECAADVALADRRYHLIYGEVKAWIDGGGIMPHRPREWFGDGGGPGPAPAGGTAAA